MSNEVRCNLSMFTVSFGDRVLAGAVMEEDKSAIQAVRFDS